MSEHCMSWIDMSDIITVILQNNDEIPFSENINDVEFIKIKNDSKDIILHKKLKESPKALAWLSADGTCHPAFEYCESLHINGYNGYLPSIDELRFLFDNADIIQYILKNVGFTGQFSQFGLSLVWTSSEASETGVYVFSLGGVVDVANKINYHIFALPLFEK